MTSIRLNPCFVLSGLIGLLFFSILSCGGSQTASDNKDSTASENTSETADDTTDDFQTNLSLAYTLSLEFDSADEDYDNLSVNIADSASMNMKLSTDGTITVRAKDFPNMIQRICTPDTELTNCDYESDALGVDFDIVVDSCGRLVSDSKCGDADSTTYTGYMSNAGDMALDNISIRTRIFFITSSSDGFSADITDTGAMEMKRMIVNLTTDSVSVGDLVATGSPIVDSQVTLVASGTISETTAKLGGANFIATVQGKFDQDPIDNILAK